MGCAESVRLAARASVFIPKPVPEEEAITLSGDYVTKVFDGPYEKTKDWHVEMKELASARGREPNEVYFFYTTCPKCSEAYGHNFIVGFARV